MLSPGPCFTALERAVLDAICEMYSSDREILEAQLSTATLINRENSGTGFYTRFKVERSFSAATKGERLRAGPETKIDGLKHGRASSFGWKKATQTALKAIRMGRARWVLRWRP